MLILVCALLGLLVSQPALAFSEPLAQAAEYYFAHYDFKTSLELWNQVLRRHPRHLPAALRAAELKLLYEGIEPARQVLWGLLNEKPEKLSAADIEALHEKLVAIHSTFLTDEGQSLFFQALPKIKDKDFAGALPLLNQAAALEKANTKVLREKARCEKKTEAFDRYYETLLASYTFLPFDTDLMEGLGEAHAYNGANAKVVEIFRAHPEALRTPRQRVAYGYALAETGAAIEAISVLQGIMSQEKQGVVSPVVYYSLGKLFADQPEYGSEAISFLERFLVSASRNENSLIDGWDPYRTADKVEPARKLLARLKQ